MLATASAALTVRHSRPSDRLPDELWPKLTDHINHHWVWVVTDDYDEIKAALVTSPAHGLLVLLRVWAAADAPKLALRKLFREVAREAQGVGLVGWMVILEAQNMSEVKLAKIASRYAGVAKGLVGFLYSGTLEQVCQRR